MAWRISTVTCDQRCISNDGEDVGCEEYIDRRHSKLCEINATSGRWSALDWISAPFSPGL